MTWIREKRRVEQMTTVAVICDNPDCLERMLMTKTPAAWYVIFVKYHSDSEHFHACSVPCLKIVLSNATKWGAEGVEIETDTQGTLKLAGEDG